MGADTSVIKKKPKRNPMTQEQKRRLENTMTLKTGEGKSIGHQRAVCLGIKDKERFFIAYILCCNYKILDGNSCALLYFILDCGFACHGIFCSCCVCVCDGVCVLLTGAVWWSSDKHHRSDVYASCLWQSAMPRIVTKRKSIFLCAQSSCSDVEWS